MPRTRTAASAALGALALAAALGATPAPQGLRWGACPEPHVPAGMQCAAVQVPLDYSGHREGHVRLALARIPAAEPHRRIGSLVLNYGGPGAPGIAGLAADPKAFAELGKRYDLVTFDPRGVGRSEPVSCGGSRRQGEEAAETATAQLAALRAEIRRCEQASGPVLPYIGTVNVSRDMDRIRQALGEKKLDYLGFSYGTRLGAVYAAQFPHRTGRMVLDGVDTLTEPLTEQALVSARGQQRALDNFLTWCAHRPGCVYGTNTRTAKEKVAALVERLDKEPLIGDDGAPVTGQDTVGAIGAALYSKAMWPDLAEALALAERDRDPVGLLQLGGPMDVTPGGGGGGGSDGGTGAGAGAVPADNAEAALTAVNCADDPDRLKGGGSPAATARELVEIQKGLRDEFLEASKIFGPNQLATVLSCYGRPAGTDFIRRIDHPGAPRMLLVGTRGDPATPYEWTEETAKRLGSAVVVDFKGDGHTGYASSKCVQEYVDGFLVDGRLPSGTRSCPAEE